MAAMKSPPLKPKGTVIVDCVGEYWATRRRERPYEEGTLRAENPEGLALLWWQCIAEPNQRGLQRGQHRQTLRAPRLLFIPGTGRDAVLQ